jgi:hypothetical protein
MSPCLTANVTVPVTPAALSLDTATTISNASPKVGDSITMTGTLRNTGGTAGSAVIYIVFYGYYAAQATFSCAANSTSPVSLSFTVPATNPTGGAVTVGTTYPVCLAFG